MKQRKDGRWPKTIVINGEPVHFYSRAKTERAAERDIARQMIEYQEKLQHGELFKVIASAWEREYIKRVPYHNYKKCGMKAFERAVSAYGERHIKEITAKDIDNLLQKLIAQQYGKAVITTQKSIINMIFKYAILNGYCEANPVDVIRLPNNLPKGKRELPTTEEMREINKHTDGFDLFPFFLLNTGMRPSEALAIKDTDIDFKNDCIRPTHHVIHDSNTPIYEPVLKTNAAEREIILLDRLKTALPKKFKGFLFSMNGDGKEPLTRKALRVRWKKYCEAYGLNITPYQLRHGYATMLYEAGVDLKDAQELMGHTDIRMTQNVYTHIRKERKNETAKKLNDFSF